MEVTSRPSGLPIVGNLHWGTHFCHFYQSREELVDCLVPFFQSGLENNEQCLWVTSDPLRATEARESLHRKAPHLRKLVDRKQIEIVDFEDWYLRADRSNLDRTINEWHRREEEALERGFAGLRLTGNTYWLEKGDWKGFLEYEARVHEAFRDRRILALCSYSLKRCGFDEVAQVLRNHKFALVKNGARWELASSATALLTAVSNGDEPAEAGCAHDVQFFEDPGFLAGKVADCIEGGLVAGEGGVVIGAQSTAARVREELERRTIDIGRLPAGQLLMLDARETLDAISLHGEVSWERFEATIEPVLAPMLAAFGKVRLYGEMVNLLLIDGDARGALQLERFWNRILEGRQASLLCGYDLTQFVDPGVLRDVTACHDGVHPAEHLEELDPAAEATRLVVELRHQTKLLESEARARRELERERSLLLGAEQRARAQAELATVHLGRLQAVTAALSEAATPADIARVIVTDMARAASADEAVLAVASEDGARLRLLTNPVAPKKGGIELQGVSIDAGLPIASIFRSDEASWFRTPQAIPEALREITPGPAGAVACLPLSLGGHRLGAIAFGYREAREFDSAERALLYDLAKEASLALDRSLLLRRAEEANRAKDEFLAMLGHELRNPLSPIVTSVQLMRLRGGEAAFGWELEIIDRQSRNLVRLVDDLLDISRVTQGRVKLEMEPIETAEVVARAVELARPLIEQRSHDLRVDVASRGLPLVVDPVRIAQAVSNILINAAKYAAPGGRITVAGRMDGGEVVIRIRDNGPGIPQDLMPRLFEPFVQGPQGSDRRRGGLGIGLTVARSLVEQHGGRIDARTELGSGSEFFVRLPLQRNDEASVAPSSGEATGELRRAARTTRVLLVDDNEDAANVTAEGLRALGYTVDVSHDPASALAAARTVSPDVAVLDIGLPSMDGYELATKLRALPGLEAMRLVAVTGYGREIDRARSEAAGLAAHLVKPVELSTLREALQSLEGSAA